MAATVPLASFTVAVLSATICILSLGFLIASVVPTARFAQPLGTLILYPMFAISGLFVPLDRMPRLLQMIARVTPSATRCPYSGGSGEATAGLSMPATSGDGPDVSGLHGGVDPGIRWE